MSSGERAAKARYDEHVHMYNKNVRFLEDYIAQQYNPEASNLKGMSDTLGSLGYNINSAKDRLRDLNKMSEFHISKQSILDKASKGISKGESNIEGLYNNLREDVSKYEFDSEMYKNKESRFIEDAGALEQKKDVIQNSFQEFIKRAPEVSKVVEEYENLPNEFLEAKKNLEKYRESLQGLTEEELGNQKQKFNESFANLKSKRLESENKIKEQFRNVALQHTGLSQEKQKLDLDMQDYRLSSDKLKNTQQLLNDQLYELKSRSGTFKFKEDSISRQKELLENQKKHFQNVVSDYNKQGDALQTKASDTHKNIESLTKDYQNRYSEYNTQHDHLKKIEEYLKWMQRESIEKMHYKTQEAFADYKARAERNSFVNLGITLLAAPFIAPALGAIGAPAWLGTAAKLGTQAIAGYNAIDGMSKTPEHLREFKGFDVSAKQLNNDLRPITGFSNFENSIYNLSSKYTPISYGALGNTPKVNIPELGNMPLSLKHYDMPSLPKLKDLPTLDSALGRITNANDLDKLTLGLTNTTTRSGKKYQSPVNPDFLKRLKKATKGLAKQGANNDKRQYKHIKNKSRSKDN